MWLFFYFYCLTLTLRKPLEFILLGELFMKYTIKKLAELAQISTRTLRYYDNIGLLKPNEINKSNYRIYDEKNVNQLQQIMFYRSMDFPLQKIKQIMSDPEFSRLEALQEQQKLLQAKQAEINALLTNIEMTIKDYQGVITMKDNQKFTAFKQQKITENEQRYGSEIRQKYGSQTVESANQKFGNLTTEEYQTMQKIEQELIQNLVKLAADPDLDSELAQKIYQKHRQWLSYTWNDYSKKAHRGLVDMYVADERFSRYYDEKAQTKVAGLLRDVVYRYTK